MNQCEKNLPFSLINRSTSSEIRGHGLAGFKLWKLSFKTFENNKVNFIPFEKVDNMTLPEF